jgi:hypothetical protein
VVKEADNRLIDAWNKVVDAQQAYSDLQKVVQEECKHPLVAHAGGGTGTPRRICVTCRFEEEGSHWSFGLNHWKAENYSPSILGTDAHRLVFEVYMNEICKLRNPTFTIQKS